MVSKQIFISHSSKDKKNVDILVQLITTLYISDEDADSYKIIYTSSDNQEHRFDGKKDIGTDSILEANKSDIFIAYVSENYKDSEICMAELGVGFLKFQESDTRNFHFVPIKDKYVSFNDMTYVLNNKPTIPCTPEKICQKFNEVFNKEQECNIDLNKRFKEIYKGYNRDIEVAKIDITKYITRTFNKTHPLDSEPFVQYVSRELYNNLHINLLNIGSEQLIWTAYKSPLNVDENDLDEDFLTDWDKKFEGSSFNIKRRLIIFKNKEESEMYLNEESLSEKQCTRKEKFEELNKGMLYWTYPQLLVKDYNSRFDSETDKTIDLNDYDENNELYLEFSYTKSHENQLEIMVFSDFDNGMTTIRKKTEPLLILNPRDRDFKTDRKILDSFHLNKFVIYNFVDLVRKGIIKKI